jgi:protein-S-isoprenylcysteine O-methyltransferase Ste14
LNLYLLKRGELIAMEGMFEFRFGISNAWLLSVPLFLSIIYIFAVSTEAGRKVSDHSWLRKKDRKWEALSHIMYFLFLLFSIVSPISFGSAFCWIGSTLFAIAFSLLVAANAAFAYTPVDAPVETGPYRFSRHPIDLFTFLSMVGIALASFNLVMMTTVLLYGVFRHILVCSEEGQCIKLYGTSYEAYLTRVPRYLPTPRFIRGNRKI